MSAWQQQQLDDLRKHVAGLLARRATLADADALRRLDADIVEHRQTIADIERRLKATP
jgi:hypothetical protein